MTSPKRPLLRYHGGKWKLADWIISHFPPHKIYVEPFGGGAAVLLRKPRSYAEVYNDLCSDVTNLFRIVRDEGEELRRLIELTPFSRAEFDLTHEPAASPVEKARRFLSRSHMTHGSTFTRLTRAGLPMKGGFRANTKRRGTTPAGDWRSLPGSIPAIIERFQGVVIESREATFVMEAHDSEHTLHYVDPPYVAETRDAGADYSIEMTNEQHEALAVVLKGLKGAVVLSGYRCPLYDRLYADWQRVEVRTYADGARERVESLWLRNCDFGLFPPTT